MGARIRRCCAASHAEVQALAHRRLSVCPAAGATASGPVRSDQGLRGATLVRQEVLPATHDWGEATKITSEADGVASVRADVSLSCAIGVELRGL